MYALQFHFVEYSCSDQFISKPRNVFIDISSDGQPRRRYFAGRFDNKGRKIEYDSIIHYFHSPVTLRMSYGPFYYTHVGVHTLFEFLQPENSSLLPWKQELIFGSEDLLLFRSVISIRKIDMIYTFELNEITCLNQSSFFLRKDNLFAEVEFNRCPQSIYPGHVNTYELGRFKSQDSSSIHTHNTMSFSTVSNFVINFYAQDMFSDHNIGVFRFIPVSNAISLSQINNEQKTISGKRHRLTSLKNNKKESKYPLLYLQNQYQSYDNGILFFNNNNELLISKKEILSASSDETGALYEITFTIKCEPIEHEKIGTMFRSWHFIVNRSTPNNINQKFLKISNDSLITNSNFGSTTINNTVELLIDGRETFRRYYECLYEAQHSINILAWELSLSFGLTEVSSSNSKLTTPNSKWITLEDILLYRAKLGIKVRIIVWRHSMMTMLNRIRYMGPVEQEVKYFKTRAEKLGISFKIFHTTHKMPGSSSYYANPKYWDHTETIVVIIAGNPRGLISCHHEKLLLIDPECNKHCKAFTGGFDIAKGRYDQPEHKIYSNTTEQIPEYYKRISILWHDSQLLIRGPTTRRLYLHFIQRWIHSFSKDNEKTRNFTIPTLALNCKKKITSKFTSNNKQYTNCKIRLLRNWNGSFHVKLFDKFAQYIVSARNFLYIEHQYPFQNGAITYYMCEALKRNPNLRVIVVTPVKTDLPTGLLGEFFDWSQDHIIDHLNLIHSIAPNRVGIFGLIAQDESTKQIKPIYVHSKLVLIDDQIMINGSINMDNISFYYCSEVSAAVSNQQLTSTARIRLGKEHLGNKWKQQMEKDYNLMFNEFCTVATDNMNNLRKGLPLKAKLIWMAPANNYDFLLKKVYYPNKISKFLYKMGINTQQIKERISTIPKLYLPSNL